MNIDYDTHPAYADFKVDVPTVDPLVLEDLESRFLETITSVGEAARLAEEGLEGAVSRTLNANSNGFGEGRPTQFLSSLQSEVLQLVRHEQFFHRKSSQHDCVALRPGFESGRFTVGRLSSDCLNKVLQLTADSSTELLRRAKLGATTREELSLNSGPLIQELARILNKEFLDNGTIESLKEYFGCPMTVWGVAIELSPSTSEWWKGMFECEHSDHALYCHVDERVDLPKAIVYLTEVGEQNGPFTVYPNLLEAMSLNVFSRWFGRVIGKVPIVEDPLSGEGPASYHQPFSSPFRRRMFMKFPTEIRFNSHFGWDVQPETDIEEKIRDSAHQFLGPPGTVVCFDGGELVHRGGLVRSGYRIALQVVFSRKTGLVERVKGKFSNA
jgi:hypothetical protein